MLSTQEIYFLKKIEYIFVYSCDEGQYAWHDADMHQGWLPRKLEV
jgi:hypothetical protein